MTPADILNEAIGAALAAGYPCSGWTLQADARGYVAWLFHEPDDDLVQRNVLHGGCEYHRTPEEAATWCLLQARALGSVS
ncbi:MAG TPA: hypothetical protein VD931_09580 [Baekduia sp.]|nr:hypothetical protein [Baekduia sp.]